MVSAITLAGIADLGKIHTWRAVKFVTAYSVHPTQVFGCFYIFAFYN